MTVAILGSGFGLYGYLPALVEGCGAAVVLPERYRARLLGRSDVGHLAGAVAWARDEAEALDRAQALVVTQRPADQAGWLPEILGRPVLRRILLEKPLAPDPAGAGRLLAALEASGRRIRIGYTMRATAWARRLAATLSTVGANDGGVSIVWRFRAHHHATGLDTWKRRVSAGGGALRFYGIHLVALLAELGYRTVDSSIVAGRSGEADRWAASFSGPGLPACRVEVDCDAPANTFSVRASGPAALDIALGDPFEGVERHGDLDRRVGPLADLCRDLLGEGAATYPWYGRAIALWAEAEARATAPGADASA